MSSFAASFRGLGAAPIVIPWAGLGAPQDPAAMFKQDVSADVAQANRAGAAMDDPSMLASKLPGISDPSKMALPGYQATQPTTASTGMSKGLKYALIGGGVLVGGGLLWWMLKR